MNSFGRGDFSKLLVGGCGTQVGLLLSCGALVAALMLCLACVFSNVFVFGLNQGFNQWSLDAQAEATTSELESLITQVKFLQGEMDFLRMNPPSSNVLAGRPAVTASQSGANLRAGPGLIYPKVGSLPLGGSLEVVGRNSSGSWWLVVAPEGFAWVSADVVTPSNVGDSIPVVTIPSLLVQPVTAKSASAPANEAGPIPAAAPAAAAPAGTPIPAAGASRQLVEDMPAYKRLKGHLLVPPVSASVSPDGSQIAITERIKLYTVTTEGALSRVWLEDNETLGPLGNVVWSPDGRYLAFVVGYKNPKCRPCRSVALLNVADATITFLQAPDGQETDMPRWTVDGRLLINVHRGEPADGVAYVYDTSGNGQAAVGSYVLSSSHFGQRWYPWQPGKTWQVGSSERADSYNAD